MVFVITACALLAVGTIGFTLLVRESDLPPAIVENAELKHLEVRRQILYDNLKDLQFEYHQGKLSDGDYQSLKAGFLDDLALVMESIERQQPPPGKQEAAAPAQRKGKAAKAEASKVHFCTSCGARLQPGNRFCGQCGKPAQGTGAGDEG